MIEVIKDTNQVARKDYSCDACDAILSSMVYPDDFDKDDLEVMSQAFNDGWKIKKGQVYNRQCNKIGGDIGTFKSRPEMLFIYFKYDMNDF